MNSSIQYTLFYQAETDTTILTRINFSSDIKNTFAFQQTFSGYNQFKKLRYIFRLMSKCHYGTNNLGDEWYIRE